MTKWVPVQTYSSRKPLCRQERETLYADSLQAGRALRAQEQLPLIAESRFANFYAVTGVPIRTSGVNESAKNALLNMPKLGSEDSVG